MDLPQDVGLWSSFHYGCVYDWIFQKGPDTFETEIHETLICL